jgi:Ca2+-transporting ATPase
LFAEPGFLPFLLPIQILWVNLVTDSFPALALSVEPTDPKVMERCPRDPREVPVTRNAAFRILVISAAMAAAGLLAFQLSLDMSADVGRARTAAFCTLVLTQLFMVFSFRSDRSSVLQTRLRGNPRLLYAVLISLALQLAVVYVPFLSGAFRTVPLEGEWLFIIPLAMLGLIVNEAAKLIGNRRHRDETCEVRADGD